MEEIICKKCGVHAAADETFCGGCGAFLEWEGERVAVDDGPPVAAAVPAANESPVKESRAKSSSVKENSAKEDPAQENPTPVPPPPAGPVAVQPAPPIERPPPPPPRPPVRRAEPGDIFCSQCGQPNNPERRFCRRCGTVLSEPAVTARLPWWKRIFHRHNETRAAAVPAADGAGHAQASGGPAAAGATAAKPASGGAPTAPSAARPLAPATSPKPPATPYAPPLRSVPSVRTPAGASARPHRLRGKVVGIVLLVIVVFAVVPSLRHRASNWYTSAYDQLVPSYSKVPVERVQASGSGDCGPPLLQDNDTVYWYTRAASDGAQSLTISIVPSFTGTISKIAFTPLTTPTHPAQSGQASAHPQQIVLSTTPPGSDTVVNLNNPPSFQQENVHLVRPNEVMLRLVTTDPGAAPATCAETGLVLYERKS
jgi:hypothetical protein